MVPQNNRISCNRHVFPGFSVILIQLCSHLCQNVALFDILRFSHHFFHFAADFATLAYTKMVIFPTVLNTASLKRAPLSRAEPSRIAHYRGYPPPRDSILPVSSYHYIVK